MNGFFFLGYANVDSIAQQNRHLVFLGGFELAKIFAILDLRRMKG